MKREELDALLAGGIVFMKYTKKSDGSERYAVGTTKADYIPKYADTFVQKLVDKAKVVVDADTASDAAALITGVQDLSLLFAPKGAVEKAFNPAQITYYDFGAKGFRVVEVANLIDAVPIHEAMTKALK